MKIFICLFAFITLFFSLSFSHVFAHAGHDHALTNLTVATIQEPLSPFVGEKVKVTFSVTDENGQPMKELAGDLVVNKVTVKEFTNETSTQESKEVYKQSTKTDTDGIVALEYTFTDEGLYDASFVWGDSEEESTTHQIFARDPTSYFLPQELGKRIWLFIGIALTGIIVGAVGAFILLTTSLHPKK